MRSLIARPVLALTALALAATAAPASARTVTDGVEPLPQAHAHNDYEHDRPLLDALSHGFTSVEADVWLVDGQLCIGHVAPDCDRTLQDLYVDPLVDIAAENGGDVYEGHAEPVRLLVDVKSGGEGVREVLERELPAHGDAITSWKDGQERAGAVEVVLSGQLADTTWQDDERWVASDGRFDSPTTDAADAGEVPVVSANWYDHFSWMGMGSMPSEQRERLHAMVADAHADGREVRFWGTPDTIWLRENVWRELLDAGVDRINTDHLAEAEEFLRVRQA
ncbi:PI-PLC domain-containing protein [Kytococcus sp. Marseille-QA3725]